MTAGVAESLARLGCGHIDLLQCHDIEFGSLERLASETLPALAALKRAGLVRHVGITGLPLKIFGRVPDGSAARRCRPPSPIGRAPLGRAPAAALPRALLSLRGAPSAFAQQQLPEAAA